MISNEFFSWFSWETKFKKKKKISADANGRIIIMAELIDDEIILLIIPYFSPNTELEQI